MNEFVLWCIVLLLMDSVTILSQGKSLPFVPCRNVQVVSLEVFHELHHFYNYYYGLKVSVGRKYYGPTVLLKSRIKATYYYYHHHHHHQITY